jgi:predicted helicase
LLFLTTDEANHHLNAAIQQRDKPVNIIDLFALEASMIDWGATFKKKTVQLKETKDLRDYQKSAIANVIEGLGHADRGKLIMACGTGKTFTSLRLIRNMPSLPRMPSTVVTQIAASARTAIAGLKNVRFCCKDQPPPQRGG